MLLIPPVPKGRNPRQPWEVGSLEQERMRCLDWVGKLVREINQTGEEGWSPRQGMAVQRLVTQCRQRQRKGRGKPRM